MSKSGEIAERILGELREGKKISVNELGKKVPLTNKIILDLMNDCGLIELKKGEVRITELGSELLTLE
jgi:predicted methyltransferase